MKTNVKILIGGAVCAAWLLAANPVLAGEVDGKGNVVPGGEKGRSICSFSGQQDDDTNEGVFRSDRVQSFGQIEKALRDFLIALGLIEPPGVACNPNN